MTGAPAHSHAQMLANRVGKRARHLRKWARRSGVTCYRLYDRDIPEIPLAIDWYEGRLHVSTYHRHGEAERSSDGLDEMLAAVRVVLDVPADACFVKHHQRQRGLQQYERIDQAADRYIVHEGPLAFRINLGGYLDTGLFLDHRRLRTRVHDEARGKRFLNLFAYTGAFTVHAAAGGARSTASVDLSKTYLDWIEDNLSLNGLTATQGKHRLLREDARRFLAQARRDRHERFDLVVVDPPTFSNSKRMQGELDLQRDHVALLNDVLAITAPGGTVYFSTNARRFRLEGDDLDAARVDEITAETQPADFRRRPHRAWRLAPRAHEGRGPNQRTQSS